MDELRSLVTVAAFLAFGAIVWWAYAPARKARFEDQAKSIFEQGDE